MERGPRVGLRELKEPKKVVAKIVRMDVNVHATQSATKPTKVGSP